MMGWILSALPRRWLQDALHEQFARSLPRGEFWRLYHFGATGNQQHHEYSWADKLPNKSSKGFSHGQE